MSLFRSSLRPRAVLSDEAVERYLGSLRARFEPDPAFRRRLRGQVLNRYVAAREGVRSAPSADRAPSRQMGRLGRAVLYASFTLGLSVSSVMAASQDAVPGDPLYPLKRQVESLRAQVAPAHLQDDLAAYALAERIGELGTLVDRGAWNEVTALAAEVREDSAAVAASLAANDSGFAIPYLAALERLVRDLPRQARAEVPVALFSAPPADGDSDPGTDPSSGGEERERANGRPGSGSAGRPAEPGDPGDRGNGTSDANSAGGREPDRSPPPGKAHGTGASGSRGPAGSGTAPTDPSSGPGGAGQGGHPSGRDPAATPSASPSPEHLDEKGPGRRAPHSSKPRPSAPAEGPSGGH